MEAAAQAVGCGHGQRDIVRGLFIERKPGRKSSCPLVRSRSIV